MRSSDSINKLQEKNFLIENVIYLDVGMVVQKARKQVQYCYSGVFLGSTIDSPTFPNKEAYLGIV